MSAGTAAPSGADFDIAIVGGGLVGASLAVALEGSGLSVALIEAAQPPASAPAWDERCIALNDASLRIFTGMGVWPELAPESAAILATHISERGRFGTARFSAEDAGIAALGANAPLRAIGAALWRRLAPGGVRLLCPASVSGIEVDGTAATLYLSTGETGSDETLRARLVVAADGARSALRELLELDAQVRDYHQHAIVSAVRLFRSHEGVAYERFTPEGPLALIPKGSAAERSRCASLVWTQPSDAVPDLMALSDADYLARAQEAFGGRLGRFTELGRRWSYPLSRVIGERRDTPRVVFIGNAAQSLHPVAAQGFNLGLRDVATLAQLLRDEPAGTRDPGDAALLAEFRSRRAQDRDSVSGMTDLMVRIFSNSVPGLAQTRHWGLVAVNLLPGLRGAVMRQHLGHLGLPRAS